MAKRVTIKDIAAKAKVSISTVHCALAEKDGVSEATRLRILDIAREFNYEPNIVAASLKRRAYRIVAVFPGPTDENRFYFTDVWNGFRDYIKSVNYFNIEVIEVPYYENDMDLTAEIARLITISEIDGVVSVGDVDYRVKEALKKLALQDIPLVLVGSDIKELKRLCCVQPNYNIIGRTLAELIASRTPQEADILLCAGSREISSHYLIVEGFEDYMKDNEVNNKIIKIYSDQEKSLFRKEIRQSLDENKNIKACCSINARGSVELGRILEEKEYIFAVGSDIFTENEDFLRKGVFSNLLQKNPYLQSYFATRFLIDYVIREIKPDEDVLFTVSEIVFRSSLPMYTNKDYKII